MKVKLIKEVNTTIYRTRREQDAEAQRIIYRLSALERVRKVALNTKIKLIKLSNKK